MATKVLQVCCCLNWACEVACCIDNWHGCEACGLSQLYCMACCWTACSPICIDLKCGDFGKACENCVKGLKYCLFSCALDVVGCCDGIYNCIKVCGIICDSGIKGHKDMMQNTQLLHDKVKGCLSLETGN